MSEQVVIVGAGLSGLACASRLQQRGIPVQIFEASDRVGGRVATDDDTGFLLDRGFQVLLTAYPETSRLLDYSSLQLASFHSGAKVQIAGKLHTLGDPARHPRDALPTMLARVGTVADKARILRLRARVGLPTLEQLLNMPQTTTLQRLRDDGFSTHMIDQFFRPFLGGIFLENQLVTSSRKFEFVFRMFSHGTAALPKNGMDAIPRQLAGRLLPGQLTFRRSVTAIERGAIRLGDGERVEAKTIVIATDPWTRRLLLGLEQAPAHQVACVYFAANKTPVKGPWLVLNGDGKGPVNNLCVPSEVQPTYAPPGESLISATVIDPLYAHDPKLEELVRRQLTGWFGKQVQAWRHLRTDRIPRPIPLQTPPALEPVQTAAKLAEGLYQCSDADWVASIEGAVRSGLQAAEEIGR